MADRNSSSSRAVLYSVTIIVFTSLSLLANNLLSGTTRTVVLVLLGIGILAVALAAGINFAKRLP